MGDWNHGRWNHREGGITTYFPSKRYCITFPPIAKRWIHFLQNLLVQWHSFIIKQGWFFCLLLKWNKWKRSLLYFVSYKWTFDKKVLRAAGFRVPILFGNLGNWPIHFPLQNDLIPHGLLMSLLYYSGSSYSIQWFTESCPENQNENRLSMTRNSERILSYSINPVRFMVHQAAVLKPCKRHHGISH